MARIARKLQKIFASSATNNGQFGSAQSGTKVLSQDLDVLQALAAFLTGWNDATIGSKRFPTLEEFQALNYINTSQLAYLFQEGISEFQIGTTYFTNSIVKKPGTYQIYGSLIDDNIGNALPAETSDANWQYLQDLSAPPVVDQATETVAGIAEIATQSKMNAATDDETIVTPLKFANTAATNSQAGTIKTSTNAQVATGTDTTTSVTPAALASLQATTSLAGLASIATNAEALALTNALKYITPATLASVIATLSQVPVGTSVDFAGSTAPAGYLMQFGQAVSRTTYAVLFSVVGTTYGVGDGATTFNLPDCRGNVVAGKDNMGGTPAGRLTGQPGGVTGTVLGALGGVELASLSIAQLPNHTHAFGDSDNAYTQNSQLQIGTGGSNPFAPTTNQTGVANSGNIGHTGGANGHNNVQPTIIMNKIIKF